MALPFLLPSAGLIAPTVVPSPGVVPSASAACPAVEVVFARGRLESPGVGILGNAFVSALRSKTNKNIGVYAVHYPADTEIDIGANDMSAHIQYMANNCPDTRLVLGGYSLGAAVTDVVLAVPFDFFGFDESAATRCGSAHRRGRPVRQRQPPGRGPSRTSTRSTATGPSSCATAPTRSATRPTRTPGKTTGPHHLANAYIQAGMANQAADFVAGRI